jgi:hypothetical protein
MLSKCALFSKKKRNIIDERSGRKKDDGILAGIMVEGKEEGSSGASAHQHQL